jgi:pimeloyl-ACP methyl ester carboxylesterase
MSGWRIVLTVFAFTRLVAALEHVTFPTLDGGLISADVYGKGDRGVVLAHGGRFRKESWAPQARALVDAGYRVLAFDFRGFGQSKGPGQADMFTAPMYLDVLGAVRYLRSKGAKWVSAVGGSFGGAAAGDAAIAAPGEIDRLVMLGAAPNRPAEQLRTPALFLVARDDASGDGPRLPGIRAQFEKAPQPKELIVVDGSAHAQFLFESDQSARVMREILRFLALRDSVH